MYKRVYIYVCVNIYMYTYVYIDTDIDIDTDIHMHIHNYIDINPLACRPPLLWRGRRLPAPTSAP